MYPRYKCLGCGMIWRTKEIMVICPICRGKGIKIKEGVDINEVVEKIKNGDLKKIARRVKNKVINRKIIRKKGQENAKIPA